MRPDNSIPLHLEEKLAEEIAKYRYDAYGFVMFAYPWGEEGTSLHDETGPDNWQKEFLDAVSAHRRRNADRVALGLEMIPFRSAVASGHGIGKSALVAWLNHWIMSTSPDCRGVTTANTANQLETKTWPELAKWLALSINRHWFTWTASSLYFTAYPEDQRKNYMLNALTVSAENTEAFAGLHNKNSAIVVIFDEASGLEAKLWEVVDGAMTDGECFFFAFGNPTRPDGEFRKCFTDYADFYQYRRNIDSRTVRNTNKTAIQQIIDKYGIDSDEVKVRVLGQFPEKAYNGFISPTTVYEAQMRDCPADDGAALIMGVDVARFGDDKTKIRFRQGRDARSIRPVELIHSSNVVVAEEVGRLASQHNVDAIVIEGVGPGAGVIDILRARGYRVHEVHPNERAERDDIYANIRCELWVKLREWLIEHGCIDKSPDLERDLTEIRYILAKTTERMQMENKRDMKDRGLPSPDDGDSLALTFAVNPARRDLRFSRFGAQMRARAISSEPVL